MRASSFEGLVPIAWEIATNSGTSRRRSLRSYFDTKDCGLPSLLANSCCVTPARLRASIKTAMYFAY